MNERTLQFRVGMFVIMAMVAAAIMVFEFGELTEYWEPRYALAIHFPSAPGVYRSTPVEQNGIKIGAVTDVVFDGKNGGVIVVVEISEQYRLRSDTQVRLQRSILGDATIDFVPGRSKSFIEKNAKLEGQPPSDPLQIVNRLDESLTKTLDSFRSTSHEWEQVGHNLNQLVDTQEGNLDAVIEETAKALSQFTKTMQTADRSFSQVGDLVGDPAAQANMKKTLEALPRLVNDTHETIATIRHVVEKADQTMTAVNAATAPLAERSASIVYRLDETLANLQGLSRELNEFAQLASKNDGSLHKLVTDPQLYQNLNQSAMSLAVLLRNLEPVARDMRIFSDKVARHPELIGVSGAIKGSSGLKEPPDDPQLRQSAGRARTSAQ